MDAASAKAGGSATSGGGEKVRFLPLVSPSDARLVSAQGDHPLTPPRTPSLPLLQENTPPAAAPVSRKRRAEVPGAIAVGGGGGGGGGGGLPLARGLDPEEDSEEEDSEEEEEAPIVGVVPAHASAAALLACVAAHSRFVPLPPLPSEVLDELVLHLPKFGFQKKKKRGTLQPPDLDKLRLAPGPLGQWLRDFFTWAATYGARTGPSSAPSAMTFRARKRADASKQLPCML